MIMVMMRSQTVSVYILHLYQWNYWSFSYTLDSHGFICRILSSLDLLDFKLMKLCTT